MNRLERIKMYKDNELNGWKKVNEMFRVYFEGGRLNG